MKEILNKSQYEAVTTTQGPLLIIAGPGSGKTKTLVERTFYLLTEKKVSPKNIFISTFTEKAASELITRISDKLKDTDLKLNLNEMYIGTLHSIFRRIIEENIEYSLFHSEFKVLDDIEQTFFIYTHIQDFHSLEGFETFFAQIPARNSWERSEKILSWVNILNEHGKNLQNLKTEDKSIIFLKELQLKYRELLVENNVIDFSTIQQELFRMLKTNENLLNKISSQLEYMMIDEYQDTNSIQEKLIFLLSSYHQNLCVVGDDDQGIYRFRGASVKNILEFPKRFDKGECKEITLNINYRSQLDILRFCNRWISLIDWGDFRHRKDIQSPENKVVFPTSSVAHIGGDSEKKWKENLYKFIKTLKGTGKIKDYNQVAFLFRSVQNQKVRDLKNYLEEMGIPIYSPRSKDFFEKIEIQLTIATLLTFFPHTKYLIFDEAQNRTNEAFYYYKYCLDLLKKEIKNDEKLYKWLVEKRKENVQTKEFPNLKEIFYQLLQFDTFKQFMNVGNVSELQKTNTHNLAIFTDILEKYEKLTKIRTVTNENIDKYIKYFFMVYLRQLRNKKIDEYENKENFPKGAVPFLTFHQAKGLEFPIVVVGSLESEPSYQEKTYEDELKERLKLVDRKETKEKKALFDFWRLYYTAFSRAQDLLILTSIEVNNYKKRSPSKIFSPLFYWTPSWEDSEKFELQHLNISPLKESNNKKLLSYTSHILLYEFCPLKYQLLKEFKFAYTKDINNFYGTFFHKVLEKTHRYIISNKEIPSDEWLQENIEATKKVLQNTLNFYFDESESNKIFSSIKKYMLSLNIDEIIGCEMKLYSIQDEYILEGVLDLVKKYENGVEIVDFKTGAFDEDYLSLYKRQLAIYTHLLSTQYPIDEISSYLYFPDETSSFVNGEITKEDVEKEMKRFNNTTHKLLEKNFPPRDFGEKCESCDFKWFCKSKIEKGEN